MTLFVNETTLAQISAELRRPELELLESLGDILGKNALSADKQKRGKEIFENLRERLSSNICGSNTIRRAASLGDEIALTAAIIDCVAGYLTSVSPVTVAVLFVKYGYSRLCPETEKPR